jgi:phosphatidylglycerophosphate synthase
MFSRMKIPNLISLSRVLAAPLMWLLIYWDYETAFRWVLTAAFFTDMIDGVIARKLKQVTRLGSILDSYGDSLTILSGIAGMIKFRSDLFEDYSIVLILVLSLHVFQLLLSLWRYGKPSAFHTWSAKAGALAIGLFILITLHFHFIPWLFWITVVILVLDAVEESILVFLVPEWKNDIKGIWWVIKQRNTEK